MAMGLIGRKLGMTRVFLKNGTVLPVTVLEVPPNYVVGIRTQERDHYTGLVLGAYTAKEKRTTKPMFGVFNRANVKPLRYIKEFRVASVEGYGLGQEIRVEEVFWPGELVDVVGISKGRGFAGTMKRWSFSGFPKSHGHRYHRAVGSIGNRSDPGRVWKGKKMAGHYGAEVVRVQSLLVVDVLPKQNVMLVKGSVPGPNKGVVYIEKSRIKDRKSQRLKLKRMEHIPQSLLRREL